MGWHLDYNSQNILVQINNCEKSLFANIVNYKAWSFFVINRDIHIVQVSSSFLLDLRKNILDSNP